MKKLLFFGLALLLTTTAFSQVGIGTTDPKATLDVVGKPTDVTALDGIIAPRLTGNQLQAKTYTADQTGAKVYVTAAATAPAGQTINVTAAGEYVYNGTAWVSTIANSKWTNDATNTRVALANLSDGVTARPAANSFVITDAGRVGIGTTQPTQLLDIQSSTTASFRAGFGVSSSFAGLRSANYSAFTFANTDINGLALQQYNIGTDASKSFFIQDNTASGSARISILPVTGFVGINKTVPTQRLDVDGNAVVSGFVGINKTVPTQRLDVDGNAVVSGRIGIGTTTPADRLHIGNLAYGGNVDSGITFSTSGNEWQGGISFKSDTGGTPRMAIESMNAGVGTGKLEVISLRNGNVGIATTVPTSKLQVVGLPSYASDAAAGFAGLTAGAFYQTNGAGTDIFANVGVLMVKQ